MRALEREAAASRGLLETLLARSKETTSQQSFQEADANIISYAAIPEDPSFPREDIVLAGVSVFAVFLGLFLVFIIEHLDKGFRSMEQVERMMGVAPLGLIPTLTGVGTIGKKPERYILEKPASAFGEAIRRLHTALLLSDANLGALSSRPTTHSVHRTQLSSYDEWRRQRTVIRFRRCPGDPRAQRVISRASWRFHARFSLQFSTCIPDVAMAGRLIFRDKPLCGGKVRL